jgi:ribonuclease D
VIDTMKLRGSMNSLLDAFSDPRIVKVFHGCESDILWLQRDFGLYVVNCFDTYQASKLLKYPALSLAHLLKFYCGVTVNKKHQLADWRQRPLPDVLLKYAREDTHYLLYVYDCLRRDVLLSHDRNGLATVFDASRRTCLLRYEKEAFASMGYQKLFNVRLGMPKSESLSAIQDTVLSALWNWRDLAARDADESPAFIMSNSELLRIGLCESVPRTEAELVSCGQPLTAYVRAHLGEVLRVISSAVDMSSGPGDAVAVGSSGAAAAAVGSSRAGSQRADKASALSLVPTRGPTSGVLGRITARAELSVFKPSIGEDSESIPPTVPPLGNGKFSSMNRGTPSPGPLDSRDQARIKSIAEVLKFEEMRM